MPGDARVSYGIPSLFNGVSQQAPSLRLPSQGEVQTNLYSSIVDGLAKRPPTKHLAKLRTADTSDAYVHLIDRGTGEQYAAIFLDGDLEIYNLADGTAATINFPDGKTYLNTTGNPRDVFKMVTIADNTIVVNSETTAIMDAAYVQETAVYEAVVHIDRGLNSIKHAVSLNGTEYSTTTAASGIISTITTASSLATAITASGTFTGTATGSYVKITKNDAADFTFSEYDSYGNQAQTGVKDSAQHFADLPVQAHDGFKVKITGDPDSTADDYYVEFETAGNSGGVWVESRGYGIDNAFDPNTMPHRLVSTSVNNFDFEEIPWEDRLVGDTDSAPDPQFIGNTIRDVFYYRNRLGFLSDENITMSRVGAPFDFWPKTITDTLDTDVIDVTVSHNKVSILKHAITFNKALLLFTDHTQFQLSADGALSPSTVKVDQTTEFKASPSVTPVAAGPNVYFAEDKGDYTGFREYFVAEDAVTNDAANVTGHVPRYIPTGVFKIDASSNEDMMIAISTTDRECMWVYKYYWVGNDKMQSSWSKWTFGDTSDTKLLSAGIIGTKIYIVVQRNNEVFLEEMDLEFNDTDTGLDIKVHLDRRNELTGSYDAGTDTTTWTMPFDDASTDIEVVLGSAFTGKKGAKVLNLSRPTNATITATGDFSAGIAYVGRTYESRYTVSQQYMREQGEGSKAIITGVLQMHRMRVVYTNSCLFRSEVTIDGRSETSTYKKTPKLGNAAYIIGKAVVDSGDFAFPVQSTSGEVTVDLINDGYEPSFWQSIEWTGTFDPLENRA